MNKEENKMYIIAAKYKGTNIRFYLDGDTMCTSSSEKFDHPPYWRVALLNRERYSIFTDFEILGV